jgi:RNA polymerase sigma factor (sigma-70 family)
VPPTTRTALGRLARSAVQADATDRDLLRRFAEAGEEAAFAALVTRHSRMVLGVCRRLLNTMQDAEDACQATFLILARKARTVRWQTSAANWLYTTARRVAARARRTAERRARREGRAAVPEAVTALDEMSGRELLAVLDEELGKLPAIYREPLVLHYLEGLSREATAGRLGVPAGTVKIRLERGRRRLEAGLSRRGVAPGIGLLALAVSVPASADPSRLAATAVGRSPIEPAVAALARGTTGIGRGLVMSALAATVLVAAVGLGQPERPNTPRAPPPAVETGPPVDRYGDPLPAGAVARLGTVRFRHGGQLESVAFSPDGKTLASGGFGRIMLWEADTGKPIASLVRTVGREARHGHTFSMAFLPDGKQLVSVGSASAAHQTGIYAFWDVATHKMGVDTEFMDVPTGWLRSLALSPDGKTAALGLDNGRLQFLNAKTHDLRAAKVQLESIGGLSFSPDGKTLAVAGASAVVLVNPATGVEAKRFQPGGRARQVAFTPDGRMVWIGIDGGDGFAKPKGAGKLVRWDPGTNIAIQTFETVPDLFLSLAVSPDGKTLATGGVNAGPFLWDAATGKSIDLDPAGGRLKPWVYGLAFAADGKSLAVADTNGRVRVWDVSARKELHRHDEHTSSIVGLAVSPDGTQAATAGGDGTVRIWDLATGHSIRSWTADNTRSVFTVAYTPDGRHLLTSGWDGSVRLWETATGKEVRRFRDDKGMARAALSPDGTLVAAAGKDGTSIVLSETATGRVVREMTGHVSELMWVTFTPDRRRLVSAADMHSNGREHFDDRSIRVWDVATGRQLHKFDAGRPHGGSAVSPDGRVLAAAVSGESSSSLRFWDLASGKEIEERRVPDVGAVAFSRDGRYLAAADRDIRHIELASGKTVQTFASGAGSANRLAFTPDGRRLVSAHDDGTALVWDVSLKAPPGADAAKAWAALASDDAAVARRAMASLVAHPAIAIEQLGEKLKPVPMPADQRSTATVIADLDAAAFAVREAASKELLRRVAADYYGLSAALEKASSEEVRRRLGEVLRSAPSPWPKLEADDLRRVRAVAVLEAVGTPEARRLLRTLADGDPYAPLTREARGALGRLP